MNKKLFSVAVMMMFLASYGIATAQNGNDQLATASLHTNESTTTNTGIACTDSDDGSNYFVKGSVQDANRPGLFRTYDKCVSDAKLLEYSCKNGSWYASYFDCQYGCSNGACLKQNETTTDTDEITDSEIDDFIEDYVDNTDVDDVDLTEIDENVDSDGMTDAEIKDYIENYLATIDFDNNTIKDEEDLQDFLVDYFAGLEEGSSDSVNLPDGSLIKLPDDEKVYVVEDGMKEWIETAEEFTQEGYDWGAIQEVDEDTLEDIQDQIQLIKDNLDRVYEVIGDAAMWVPNLEAFEAEGLDWADVEDIDGSVEDTYEVVNIVADDNGNLYYITENGQKQLIMNQDALESVTDFEDTSAVEASLEEIMSGYMEQILAAVEGMDEDSDPSEVIDLSTQMADELAQVMDELVSQITSSIDAAIGSGSTASAGIDGADWDSILEDIMAEFDEDLLGGMSEEDIEESMESIWQQFKAEYSDSTSYGTTTVTTGTGTGETWEEAWQNLMDNLQTETTTTTGESDDEIASELEDAWGDFEDMFGESDSSSSDMSDWEDFLGDYDYSSDLEDMMSQFESSGNSTDLDSLLSENEDLLNAGGIADSLAGSGVSGEDMSGIFDMMSEMTGQDFSGLSELITSLSDDSTEGDIEDIMGFVSDFTGEDFSGISSLISGLSDSSGSDMSGISDMLSGMSGSDMSGLSDLMSGLSGSSGSDMSSISDMLGGMSGSDMSGLSDLMGSLDGASGSDMSGLSDMFSQMGSGSGSVDINDIMSTVSGLDGSSGDISSIMDMVSGLTGEDFSGISSLISGLSGMSGSSGTGSGSGSSGLGDISSMLGSLSGMGGTGSSGLSSLLGGLSGTGSSGMGDISSLLGGMTGSDSSGLSSLLGGLSGMGGSDMSGLSSMMSGLGGSDMSDLSSLMGGMSGMGDLGSMLGSMSFAKSDKFLKSIDDVNLIREDGDYKVYDISSGYKTWIPTAEEFNAKGYSWNDIVVVEPEVFEAYSASR